MLWGFSNFSKGMAESDLAYQNKRKNNLALYNNFKQMFPDASAADHEKFIDEIAGDSRYLKNFLPSSAAIGSYISNRQLEKERETQRFEMQMAQSQLTTNKMMQDALTQMAPSIEDVETKGREKWIGMFADGSAAQKQAGSWWDNNPSAVRSSVRSARTDFAKKASTDLTEDDLNKGDAHIAQKIAKLYGLEKLSTDQVSLIKETALERIGDRRRQIELPVYDQLKSDPELGRLLLSNDPNFVKSGEERIKQVYEQNGLIATDKDITRYKKLHADVFNLNKGNRIEKAQQDVLLAPEFAPQRQLITDLINGGAKKETVIEEIKKAIIDKDYSLFDQQSELVMAERIYNLMQRQQGPKMRENLKNISNLIQDNQLKTTDDIDTHLLKVLRIDPASEMGKVLKEVSAKRLQNKTQSEIREWRSKRSKSDNGQTFNSIMSIDDATRGAAWNALEQEYTENGWTFDAAEKIYWEKAALNYYQSNSDTIRKNYLTSLGDKLWFKNAIAKAADGDSMGALTDIRLNLKNMDLPDRLKDLLAEDAGELVASMSQTVMTTDYKKRVLTAKEAAGKEFDGEEEVRQENAKVAGIAIAGQFGIDTEDLGKDSTAKISGNIFQEIARQTGLKPNVISSFVSAVYGTDDETFQRDVQTRALKPKVMQMIQSQIKPEDLRDFDTRKRAFTTRYANEVTLAPVKQEEILSAISSLRREISKDARDELKKYHSDNTPKGLLAYKKARDKVALHLHNKIKDLLRYKDRGDRIIGYFDERRVDQAFRQVQEALTKEVENYKHPAEISGVASIDAGGKPIRDFSVPTETPEALRQGLAAIDQQISAANRSGDYRRVAELERNKAILQRRLMPRQQ